MRIVTEGPPDAKTPECILAYDVASMRGRPHGAEIINSQEAQKAFSPLRELASVER